MGQAFVRCPGRQHTCAHEASHGVSGCRIYNDRWVPCRAQSSVILFRPPWETLQDPRASCEMPTPASAFASLLCSPAASGTGHHLIPGEESPSLPEVKGTQGCWRSLLSTGFKSLTEEVRHWRLWAVICPSQSQTGSPYQGPSAAATQRYSPITPAETGRGRWEKRPPVCPRELRASMSAYLRSGSLLQACAASLPGPAMVSGRGRAGGGGLHTQDAEESPSLRERRLGSPHPHSMSFPVMTLILATEDPFQEGGGQGLQRLPRDRRASSPRRTMWQRGGRKGVLGTFPLGPSPSPQQITGKSATVTTVTQSDTQEASGNTNPGVSAAERLPECTPPPPVCTGLSPSLGSVWKKPSQGREGCPRSLPQAGSPGATGPASPSTPFTSA